MAGVFITIEGSDGSGKTTQIELLAKYLTQIGYEVILTREPGGTPIGEKIRNIILDTEHTEMAYITEAMLYAASRAQHVAEYIKPALEEGKIVICDRFVDSSVVYQGIGRGLGIGYVEGVNQYATGGLKPHVTLFLDIDPKLGILRKKHQTVLDRLEQETLEFHNKVYEGYKMLAERHKERIKVVNATKSIEEVHKQIQEIVHTIL